MCPVSECHVFVWGSLDIESVGFRELTFVSVRRCMPNADVFARFDQLAIDFCISYAVFCLLNEMRSPSKDFFDCRVDYVIRVSVLSEKVELRPGLKQSDHSTGCSMSSCLIASKK